MNAQPAPERPSLSPCPLCGEPAASAAGRCESCGMTLAGIDGRPGPFSRATLWWWAAALVAIYLVVLAVVVTFPA